MATLTKNTAVGLVRLAEKVGARLEFLSVLLLFPVFVHHVAVEVIAVAVEPPFEDVGGQEEYERDEVHVGRPQRRTLQRG